MKVTLGQLKKEIKSSKKPVLIEFWGSWCPPCQIMKSTLKEFEQETEDKIKLIKLNPDMNPSLSGEFNVKGLPTFILFKEGKEIKRAVGAKSKEELHNLIKTS